ncbi:hypothetical protein CYG49_02330 [Candidatus Saccharibacteria bacterium]|nr:MAG: hypothetical protein CYG49_02330 [Candidatus Saccharibacteria bacterium]
MFISPKKITLKTYQAGLLQAKAYRSLHTQMSEALKPYGITLPQWGLLGLLNDKKSMSPSELSQELGVKPPVTTSMLHELENKQLIKRLSNPKDNRASSIQLSDEGKRIIPAVEKELRKDLVEFLKDIRPTELLAYMKVLEKLSSKIAR